MIIECINCNKKFNVDSDLIPSDGRQIQCGSCNHTWHYIIEDESEKTLILNNAVKPQNIKEDVKLGTTDIENLVKIKKIKPLKQETYIKADNKVIESKSISNFFSYLLVFIISFVALIVLIDTFKTPLIKIFPQLEIFLFNLFETLKDVKLFIIDLT
tara:strand:+ start:58 stop:528 length:471 start_codon:yes stop_codon:yes gene_type:complete